MNASKYKYLLYLIAIVIFCTIGIQVYWNYKNYTTNKQQLINDVQTSLDNAVNRYYESLAKESTFSMAVQSDSDDELSSRQAEIDSLIKFMDSTRLHVLELNKSDSILINNVRIIKGLKGDSIFEDYAINDRRFQMDSFLRKEGSLDIESNEILFDNIKGLTLKTFVSITTDSLNIEKIDSLVRLELERKHIAVDFYLDYRSHDNHIKHYQDNKKWPQLDKNHSANTYLSTDSQSTFLPPGSFLTILFTNTTKVILNRMLGGIIISTLLVLAVISSLFYLLKVIKHQKQLAEVKNDLISNITHEFKTPIATIGVALESIKSFNAIDDKEKTKSYLDMSSSQLAKLNTMVEKLLETATLDSENLELNKDRYNISEVITSVVKKHEFQNQNKSITLDIKDNVFANVDVFHFENAINNILDNAYKYGGNNIAIQLKTTPVFIAISISDDGNSLSKVYKDRIFEKFYRVPKGNTHDIKGFGIGLYYTRKIIEKHDGSISLELKNNHTAFKILLPNV